MQETFFSVEFWKFALTVIGVTIAWFVNEWRKRYWEQYPRKEASYKKLLRCIRGFYIGTGDTEKLRGDFLEQLNQCWLYCPDEVIKKGYAFLDTVHTNQGHSDAAKAERAMGDFVAAIRNDLFSRKLVRRTYLTGADFRHLGVNRKQE